MNCSKSTFLNQNATLQSIFSVFRIPANSRAITTFFKVCKRSLYVQRNYVLLNIKKKCKCSSVWLKKNSEYILAKTKDQLLSTEPLAPEYGMPSPLCSTTTHLSRVKCYPSMKSFSPFLPYISITERVVYFTCPTTNTPYDIAIPSLCPFFNASVIYMYQRCLNKDL